jgi:myo-inositol catabolism protein IolC
MALQDLKNTLTYIHSELNRIETIAGTLSSVERDHFNRLTNFDHRELQDIAVEEQSAARQLGEVKQMCLAIAQKVEGVKNAVDRGELGEVADRAQGH